GNEHVRDVNLAEDCISDIGRARQTLRIAFDHAVDLQVACERLDSLLQRGLDESPVRRVRQIRLPRIEDDPRHMMDSTDLDPVCEWTGGLEEWEMQILRLPLFASHCRVPE